MNQLKSIYGLLKNIGAVLIASVLLSSCDGCSSAPPPASKDGVKIKNKFRIFNDVLENPNEKCSYDGNPASIECQVLTYNPNDLSKGEKIGNVQFPSVDSRGFVELSVPKEGAYAIQTRIEGHCNMCCNNFFRNDGRGCDNENGTPIYTGLDSKQSTTDGSENGHIVVSFSFCK